MDFFRSLIALDSPLRIFYHFVRGVLASKLYGNPARDMVVIGITGTKGKSTVSNLVTRGLIASGKKVFMFSTVNYCINGTFYDNELKMTTPSPFVLQRLLNQAKAEGCEYAVIETSSHSLLYNRVYGIPYDVVAMTNISQDHLDLHHTMDSYVATKLRLFDGLISSERKRGVKKVAVVNIDSEYGSKFLACTSDVLYTYGLRSNAQIYAQDIRYDRRGTGFTVKMPGTTFSIRTPLRGGFNVYNILASVAILISQRVPTNTLSQVFEEIPPIPGRFEEIMTNAGFSIFVDYAHTEDSLRNVLETIREMDGIGKIITVFGATGDRDKTKRPKMGHVVDSLSDVVILTEDDSYTEDTFSIIREVSVGIKRKEGEGFWVVPDREDAIRTALITAMPNDVVLIAGKGSESVIVRNDGKHPWKDADVVHRILDEIEMNKISSYAL